MNYILLIITFLTSLGSTIDTRSKLVIKVTDIKSNSGQLIIGLHNSRLDFPKKAYLKKTALISEHKATVVFENIPRGTYAASVLHDENKNGKIDFNFFHYPVEKAAFSNNAKGFLGPPDFEDAKFTLKKNTTITISMR